MDLSLVSNYIEIQSDIGAAITAIQENPFVGLLDNGQWDMPSRLSYIEQAMENKKLRFRIIPMEMASKKKHKIVFQWQLALRAWSESVVSSLNTVHTWPLKDGKSAPALLFFDLKTTDQKQSTYFPCCHTVRDMMTNEDLHQHIIECTQLIEDPEVCMHCVRTSSYVHAKNVLAKNYYLHPYNASHVDAVYSGLVVDKRGLFRKIDMRNKAKILFERPAALALLVLKDYYTEKANIELFVEYMVQHAQTQHIEQKALLLVLNDLLNQAKNSGPLKYCCAACDTLFGRFTPFSLTELIRSAATRANIELKTIPCGMCREPKGMLVPYEVLAAFSQLSSVARLKQSKVNTKQVSSDLTEAFKKHLIARRKIALPTAASNFKKLLENSSDESGADDDITDHPAAEDVMHRTTASYASVAANPSHVPSIASTQLSTQQQDSSATIQTPDNPYQPSPVQLQERSTADSLPQYDTEDSVDGKQDTSGTTPKRSRSKRRKSKQRTGSTSRSRFKSVNSSPNRSSSRYRDDPKDPLAVTDGRRRSGTKTIERTGLNRKKN